VIAHNEEEIPDLLESRIAADLLLEALEDFEALDREADLGFGRELTADPARGLAGGAAPDCLPLEHDHVTHAAPREVVGDAAPDDTASDDDHAGRPWRRHGSDR